VAQQAAPWQPALQQTTGSISSALAAASARRKVLNLKVPGYMRHLMMLVKESNKAKDSEGR
jgi:hypothetical protein